MDMLDTSIGLQQNAKGQRPQYFDDPSVEKVLAITMALAGEFSVMRDRLDSLERLLEAGVTVTREALDGYVPDERARSDRDAWRSTFLDVLLRVVQQDRAAMKQRIYGDG
jgi:hypothetical protein